VTLEPLDTEGGVRITFFRDLDGVLLKKIIEGELEIKLYNL